MKKINEYDWMCEEDNEEDWMCEEENENLMYEEDNEWSDVNQ